MAKRIKMIGKPAEPSKEPPKSGVLATYQNDIFGNFVSGMNSLLRNPDSVMASRGLTLKDYAEVLRDDQAVAAWQQRRLLVTSMDYNAIPGDSSRKAAKAASFMQETLDHIGWDDITDKMLYGVFYGYAMGECVWINDGSYIVPEKILVRDPARFMFDADGRIRLLTRTNYEGELMPEKKFWHFSTGESTHDNPYGKGLAHWLYWPVFFKRNAIKLWLTYLDKYGMPTAMGKFPKSATLLEQEALLDAIDSIHSRSAIALPDGQEVRLLEGARSGDPGYHSIIREMNTSIAKIIMSQAQTTDGGAKFKVDAQQDLAGTIAEADSDLINLSFERGPLRWLMEWNFPGVAPPRIMRQTEQQDDLEKQSKIDTAIFAMGFTPTLEYIQKKYGDGWTGTSKPMDSVTTPKAMTGTTDESAPAQFAESPAPARTPAISQDQFIEKSMVEAGPIFKKMIEPLKKKLKTVDGIYGLYDSMSSKPWEKTMADSLLLAHLAGQYSVILETGTATTAFAEPWLDLPFNDAIEFFRSKTNIPTKKWSDLQDDAANSAFFSAGAMKADLLNDLRAAADKAIAEGTTIEEFRDAFDETVASNGWEYFGTQAWRSRLIFQQNIFSAYGSGRYEQLTHPDVLRLRPFWQYAHSGKVHPRPEHKALNGKVFRADDPWWQAHMPPRGFGCGCTVFSVSQSEMDADGLSVSRPPAFQEDPGFNGQPSGKIGADSRNAVREKIKNYPPELAARIEQELGL